ncbi:MAG: enoyl-CoA hydratase/isomerase family protein [Firmicutes bacterium]|nr:enoyl-CoA hydratase/isomerase family protein [Bacillota bacterium]
MTNIVLKKTGHTAILTLNKKSTMNALCAEFLAEINEALDSVEADEDIYTLIITGSGKSFVAGADIDEMVDMTPDQILEWSGLGSGLNLRIEKMPIPVIAAINGYALGGGLELALACDIRIASENARMGLPEVKLGVICGAGGTQRLPDIVGESIAKEMIFTGRSVNAEEALKIGLISKVFPQDKMLAEALSLALSIEKNGQLAVRAAKKAVNFGLGKAQGSDIEMPMREDLPSIEERCLFERETFAPLFATEDQKIGMGGFLRKEKDIKFKNK